MSGFYSITEGKVWERAYCQNNYEVEYSDSSQDENLCAIYFSSSGIYFPNSEEILEKRIIEDNFYEWKKRRIRRASKHIFVRDVAKNFYVIGINKRCDSIDALLELLKKETEGYDTITIGSSGGAFMAVIAGCALNSKMVFSFSCFWSLNNTQHGVWHLVDQHRDDEKVNRYYELIPFVKEHNDVKIVYVWPALNTDKINNDIEQSKYTVGVENILSLPMDSREHGVIINKMLLDEFLNADFETLSQIKPKKTYLTDYDIGRVILPRKQYISMCVRLGLGKAKEACRLPVKALKKIYRLVRPKNKE